MPCSAPSRPRGLAVADPHWPPAPLGLYLRQLGQPGWFYAAWAAQQWGILVLCVVYCGAWMHGVWTHWIRPSPQKGDGVDTITLPPGWRGA